MLQHDSFFLRSMSILLIVTTFSNQQCWFVWSIHIEPKKICNAFICSQLWFSNNELSVCHCVFHWMLLLHLEFHVVDDNLDLVTIYVWFKWWTSLQGFFFAPVQFHYWAITLRFPLWPAMARTNVCHWGSDSSLALVQKSALMGTLLHGSGSYHSLRLT